MKKRNKIILCICSILVIMASIFSFIPFKADKMQVNADTSTEQYYYSGSNIVSKTTFDIGSSSINLFNPIFQNSHVLNSTYNSTRLASTQSLYLNSGTYVFSTNFDLNVYRFVVYVRSNPSTISGGTIIFSSSWTSLSYYSFTINEGGYFGLLVSRIDDVDILPSDISGYEFQLQEGSSASEYVPYNPNHYLNFDFDFNTYYSNTRDYFYKVITPTIYVNDYQYMFINLNSFDVSYSTLDIWTNDFGFYNFGTNYLSRFPYKNNNYIYQLNFMFDYTELNASVFGFNGNISTIVLGSYLDAQSYFLRDYGQSDFLYNSKYNFISYIDNNGYKLNIFIPLDSEFDNDYFNFRTYGISISSDTSYINGVNAGYNKGFNDGEISGQKLGYDNGYNVGYNKGYNVGLNDSNQYSFLNLISATIDAPMSYFQSLFNFELLGVNLQGFLLALFTLCVIITIIKLCIGR